MHHILIVEDDLMALEVLTNTLSIRDYQITTASDAEQALELLKSVSPDLILSDYILPGMNGIDFLKHTHQICPNATRMIITGYSDINMAVEAINEANIYSLILKPWKAKELLLSVRRALEHRALMNQAIHSEKMASLGQLAAGIAHEINNPVGYVLSNLGTLTDYVRVFKLLLDNYTLWIKAVEDRDIQGQQAITKRIQALQNQEDIPYIINDVDDLLSESIEGITRVKEIVQELKCFARTDETEISENNVNEIIQVALKLVWNELRYKCHVEKKLGYLPEILCDAGHLKQVFVNLFVNASQAIKKHGTITIETKVTNTHVTVEIADTGEGISKEQLPLIFEPFFTTKPAGEGTGLGLAISYDIVQSHGGVIEVESELGQGTRFKIMLPIKKKGHVQPGIAPGKPGSALGFF